MERVLTALREGGYALNEKGVADGLEALSLPIPVQPTQISQFLRAVRTSVEPPDGSIAIVPRTLVGVAVQALDLDWRAKGTTTSLLPIGIAGQKKGVVTGPIVMQVCVPLSFGGPMLSRVAETSSCERGARVGGV